MVRALMNKRMKLAKNQKGMTLIELMAVVVILGILAAVAGAAVVNGFDKAKTSSNQTTASVLEDAAQRYLMDTSATLSATTATEIDIDDLKEEGYLKSAPQWSNGTAITSVSVKYTSATDKTLSFTITPAQP